MFRHRIDSIGNLLLDGKKMHLKRTERLLEDIEEKLISNQTPRVIFAAKGDSIYSHVLNVYGLTCDEKGISKLHVFETNYYPELIPYQAHWIEIDAEVNATHAPLVVSRIGHPRVGKIKFSFEEKKSTVDYVKGISSFCREIINWK